MPYFIESQIEQTNKYQCKYYDQRNPIHIIPVARGGGQ